MHGLRAATLALGMLLLAPLGAAAQACMCAETGLELPLSDLGQEQVQDARDAQDPDALASREELAAAKLAVPADGEDLPWCTSENDAKCSKLPAGSLPSPMSIDASPLLALHSVIALPSYSSIVTDLAEYSCGGPRDAVRSMLERPPQ